MSGRWLAALLVVISSASTTGCCSSELTQDESDWCGQIETFSTSITDTAISLGVMTYFDYFFDQRGFDLDGRSAIDIQDQLPLELIIEWNLQDDSSAAELRASYLGSVDGKKACKQAFKDAHPDVSARP